MHYHHIESIYSKRSQMIKKIAPGDQAQEEAKEPETRTVTCSCLSPKCQVQVQRIESCVTWATMSPRSGFCLLWSELQILHPSPEFCFWAKRSFQTCAAVPAYSRGLLRTQRGFSLGHHV